MPLLSLRRYATDRALLRLLGEQGGVISAGEAAARSGQPLAQVERRLLALAVAVGADLRVSQEGELAYCFPRQLRRRLLARSWRLRLELWIGWIWQQLFRLIRLGVGVVLVLLVSLVTTVVVLLALIQLLRSDDGIEALFSLLLEGVELLVRLLVLLFSDGFQLGAPGPGGRREKRFLFFEAVFSVLFGDGDPNHDLEQRRWSRIGCFLRHRGGAVIAEDLAPLLDLPQRPGDGERAAELADAAMLAVLQRFDGRPEVSEQGQLAFRFPSLQLQASPERCSSQEPPRSVLAPAGPEAQPGAQVSVAGRTTRAPERPAPALRERRIPFSRALRWQLWLYGALTGLLLLLSPLLFVLIQPTPAPLALLAWFSISYALLLVLIPLLRLQVLRWRNARIDARNQRRLSWRWNDPRQRGLLARKRAFARRFALRRQLGELPLAYTSERDLQDQQIQP